MRRAKPETGEADAVLREDRKNTLLPEWQQRVTFTRDQALPLQPSTSTILWATMSFTAWRAGFRYCRGSK